MSPRPPRRDSSRRHTYGRQVRWPRSSPTAGRRRQRACRRPSGRRSWRRTSRSATGTRSARRRVRPPPEGSGGPARSRSRGVGGGCRRGAGPTPRRFGSMGDRRRPLRLRWSWGSWGSSCPDRSRFPNTSQQLLLRLDIDAVQPCRVEPEDFFLRRQRQLHAGFLADGFRQFEGHEFLDQPLGRPDAVVAAVEYLVLADPEQQLRDHMREVFRTRVNRGQHDRQARVEFRLLGGDPAKIVQTRQATVLDDKVQILKVGRRVVDIGNVESIEVQRQNRRALVHMDVLDAQFPAAFEILLRTRVRQFVALAVTAPFCRIELDALDAICLGQLVQIVESGFAVARIEGAVDDETIRMLFLHLIIFLGRVEAVLVKVRQVSRLANRHVVVALDEQVVIHDFRAVVVELLLRPQILLGTQVRVVRIKAIDELLAMHVLQIGLAAVPQMDMSIDDENVFTALGSIHGMCLLAYSLRAISLPPRRLTGLCSDGVRWPGCTLTRRPSRPPYCRTIRRSRHRPSPCAHSGSMWISRTDAGSSPGPALR